MANDQQSAARFSDAERGTQPEERGVSTAPFQPSHGPAQIGGAAASSPAPVATAGQRSSQPYRAVIFYLEHQGHRRAGYSDAEARNLVQLIRLYIHNFKKEYQQVYRSSFQQTYGRVYDPFDVRPFNSFAELLAHRPKPREKWQDIMIITHGPGVLPLGLTPFIWLGDKEYFVGGSTNDLLDAMNENLAATVAFQRGFAPESSLRVIACGPGSSTPDLAIYLRELFGVEGAVSLPKVFVDFDTAGRLGTPVEGGKLRPLRPDEWLVIDPKGLEYPSSAFPQPEPAAVSP